MSRPSGCKTGVLSTDDVKHDFQVGLPTAAGEKASSPFASAVDAAPALKFVDPSPAPPPQSKLALWYRQPARNWIEALALGNGRLGAMVFGGVEKERLGLNEDTLWSGGPYQPAHDVPEGTLQRIRALAFAGKSGDAQNLAGQLQGSPSGQASYQTVGELRLVFAPQEPPASYRRDLDLDTAVATVNYVAGGVHYRREYFVSSVDQVVVARLTADKPGQISFDATLTTPQHQFELRTQGNYDIILDGRNGDMRTHPVIPGALKFEARARIIATAGQTVAHDGIVSVKNADAVSIFVAAATSYKSYEDVTGDPDALCREALAKLHDKPFESIKQDHIDAYRTLFRRVSLDLGDSTAVNEPTDQRLRDFAGRPDPGLAALYFQFGRYLLISCSRPGGQAANLQGLWNQDLMASWGGKYTVNINTEMNYWPSFAGNLAECQEPLLRLVQDCAQTGAVTAEKLYHAHGWVLHHNTDLWRATAPIDGSFWGQWPSGGAWLCNELYQEYCFDEDSNYLQTIYPLLKGAGVFPGHTRGRANASLDRDLPLHVAGK